jgi:hypothetical protein
MVRYTLILALFLTVAYSATVVKVENGGHNAFQTNETIRLTEIPASVTDFRILIRGEAGLTGILSQYSIGNGAKTSCTTTSGYDICHIPNLDSGETEVVLQVTCALGSDCRYGVQPLWGSDIKIRAGRSITLHSSQDQPRREVTIEIPPTVDDKQHIVVGLNVLDEVVNDMTEANLIIENRTIPLSDNWSGGKSAIYLKRENTTTMKLEIKTRPRAVVHVFTEIHHNERSKVIRPVLVGGVPADKERIYAINLKSMKPFTAKIQDDAANGNFTIGVRKVSLFENITLKLYNVTGSEPEVQNL